MINFAIKVNEFTATEWENIFAEAATAYDEMDITSRGSAFRVKIEGEDTKTVYRSGMMLEIIPAAIKMGAIYFDSNGIATIDLGQLDVSDLADAFQMAAYGELILG